MNDPSIEHLLESLDFADVDADAMSTSFYDQDADAALSQAGIDVNRPQPDELSSPAGVTKDMRLASAVVAATPEMLWYMRCAHDMIREDSEELSPEWEVVWVAFDKMYHVIIKNAQAQGWTFE